MKKTSWQKTALAGFLLWLLPQVLLAQADSSKIALSFGGFVDAYYAYDFSRPDNHIRQPFLYNHNRHNEFNINLALLSMKARAEKWRATIGLQAGNYPQDNYAAQEEQVRQLFEAWAGISLNAANTLWLDAGIFPSHLGFESAISADNLTLSRSLVAESSPYYLSGAKLTFTPSESFTVLAVVCNGWQRIARPEGNQHPAFGTQVTYAANGFTLNWSTFLGSETPDTEPEVFFFNNFYVQWGKPQKVSFILGADFGKHQKEGEGYWFGLAALGRWQLSEKSGIGLRAEYFNDPDRMVINYDVPYSFKAWAASVNYDVQVTPQAVWRTELRTFRSADAIFANPDGGFSTTNMVLMTSLAVKIGSL